MTTSTHLQGEDAVQEPSIREPSPKRRRLDAPNPSVVIFQTTSSNPPPTQIPVPSIPKPRKAVVAIVINEPVPPPQVVIESIEVDLASPSSRRRQAALQEQDNTDLSTDEERPNHRPLKDTWVVTTPAEIKSSISKARAVKEARAEAAKNGQTLQIKATSSRVANRERRKKKKQTVRFTENDGTIVDSTGEGANEDGAEGIDSDGEDSTPRQRKPRKRADTPDGAENVTIVPSMVTMYDLASRDRRLGKKSEREKKMRLIDWGAVKARRKQEEIEMAMRRGGHAPRSDDEPDQNGEIDENAEVDVDAELERLAAKNKSKRKGIQIRVVNGEHVIDEQSQKVDRHAMANKDVEELEEYEDDDLTKRFNSQTYVNMKRRVPAERITNRDKWGDESTEKFYECLSKFGTDFMIISKMFPGRSRRHIRAKFVREERVNPSRVSEALVGRERGKWDIEIFKQETGLDESDFKDPKAVANELKARYEEREQQIEEQRRETAELKRQRRAAGDLRDSEEEDEDEDVGEVAANKGKESARNNARGRSEDILEIVDE